MYDRHTRASEVEVALRKLRLECCLLVFRHCASTHRQNLWVRNYAHDQIAYVVRNTQLALECVALEPELGQIDEVTELLRQFSCKKVKMLANKQGKNAATCNLPPIELSET